MSLYIEAKRHVIPLHAKGGEENYRSIVTLCRVAFHL